MLLSVETVTILRLLWRDMFDFQFRGEMLKGVDSPPLQPCFFHAISYECEINPREKSVKS